MQQQLKNDKCLSGRAVRGGLLQAYEAGHQLLTIVAIRTVQQIALCYGERRLLVSGNQAQYCVEPR